MTKEEWDELKSEPLYSERGVELLNKTFDEEECPEDYDGPCYCKECRRCFD